MDKDTSASTESKNTESSAAAESAKDTVVAETKHSNKALVIVLGIIGALVVLGIVGTVLAGMVFKKAAKNVIENATDTKITTKKDGTTTVESKDGSSSYSTEQKLPSDFPSGIPLYSGQKIVSSSKVKYDGETNWSVYAETNDSVTKTAEKARTLYSGWESTGEQEYNDSTLLYFKKGDYTVYLTIAKSDSKTTINYSVSQQKATQ